MALILVIEDEIQIADMIRDTLKLAGYETLVSHDGFSGLAAAREHKPDLIITDVNMPRVDGFELLEKLRASGNNTPAIVLTARQSREDIAAGFTRGADDYITKPFSLEELVLRVKAVLRRTSGESTKSQVLTCGPLKVIDDERIVELNGSPVDLTRTEYRLLLELLEKKGKVVDKRDLLENIWGMGFATGASVVDTYISYLRRKLHTDDWKGIQTIRGEGFKIVD
jgi:two-component system OmpR family response regulator